jgi:hypothetical protein
MNKIILSLIIVTLLLGVTSEDIEKDYGFEKEKDRDYIKYINSIRRDVDPIEKYGDNVVGIYCDLDTVVNGKRHIYKDDLVIIKVEDNYYSDKTFKEIVWDGKRES